MIFTVKLSYQPKSGFSQNQSLKVWLPISVFRWKPTTWHIPVCGAYVWMVIHALGHLNFTWNLTMLLSTSFLHPFYILSTRITHVYSSKIIPGTLLRFHIYPTPPVASIPMWESPGFCGNQVELSTDLQQVVEVGSHAIPTKIGGSSRPKDIFIVCFPLEILKMH